MAQINFLSRQKVKLHNSRRKTILTTIKNGKRVLSGQEFFIHIKTSKKAYLYVLYLDSSNKLYSLYNGNRILPGKDYFIPTKRGELYEFDQKTGVEMFYIYLSRNKNIRLKNILRKIPENGRTLHFKSDMKMALEYLRSKEGKIGIVKARIKEKKIINHLPNESYKVKPLGIWFKQTYSYKIVLFHTKTYRDLINANIKRKVKKESWIDNNLFIKTS